MALLLGDMPLRSWAAVDLKTGGPEQSVAVLLKGATELIEWAEANLSLSARTVKGVAAGLASSNGDQNDVAKWDADGAYLGRLEDAKDQLISLARELAESA